MIAVDTQLLVYAHREDSPHHEAARSTIEALAARTATWAVPWPCVHQFLSVITGPEMEGDPTPHGVALRALQSLEELDNLAFIHETPHHASILAGLLAGSGWRGGGPAVQDARIAAICIGNGIKELWTVDRDFSWFPELHTHNPLTLNPLTNQENR